jgi:hypothetical protein
LFACAFRDPLPVQPAFPGPLAVEFHDAVIRQHRGDAVHAQLRGLLHDEVHAVAARDALHQVDLQVRLRRIRDGVVNRERHAVFAEAADRCGPFAVVAVEDVHGIADTQAQDAAQVTRGFLSEIQLGTGCEPFGNVKSFQRHDRCASSRIGVDSQCPHRGLSSIAPQLATNEAVFHR